MANVERQQTVLNILQNLHQTKDKGLKELFWTELNYAQANHLLFEVIEYVEPRMKADQAYPPVVGVAVMRMRHELGNAEAEARLREELGR